MSLSIDYIEFSSPDLEATETFFVNAFGWSFVEYGPDYRDIRDAGIGGGIERAAERAPLVILKSDDLERDLARVQAAGGTLTRGIFDFPGGRRFEFREPGGTTMAIWSES